MKKHIQLDNDYPLRDHLNDLESKYDQTKFRYKRKEIDWFWWWTQNHCIDLEGYVEDRLENEV